MKTSSFFDGYWRRFQFREQAHNYRAKCLRWYWCKGLNPVERLLFDKLRNTHRILDFGAGDLRLKKKFVEGGYRGRYETLEADHDIASDYRDIGEVSGRFGAILCLEVIEHLPLESFQDLMGKFAEILEPGGILVVSTPNPLCIVPMWFRDASHIQQYPLHDLIAYFLSTGFTVEPYRVRLTTRQPGPWRRFRLIVQRAMCYFLAVDYADGLLILATKSI